jgi:hypothetical protein
MSIYEPAELKTERARYFGNCPACFGAGVGEYIFHGVEANGEPCIEPVRCDACDGLGSVDEPVRPNQTAKRAA